MSLLVWGASVWCPANLLIPGLGSHKAPLAQQNNPKSSSVSLSLYSCHVVIVAEGLSLVGTS